ncbi:MAG: nucleotidyltransferase family protein [Blastocatellales bacterium]
MSELFNRWLSDHEKSVSSGPVTMNLEMNLRMAGELILLIRKMEGDGIRVIPYKGPTLASLAYGDLSLRTFGDLDLLIAREDTGKAFTLMRDLGYAPEIELDAEGLREFQKYTNVLAWWNDERRTSVEIHWELSPGYLPFPVGFDELYSRRQEVEVGGHLISTLSNEDLLIYLCLHGAKHAWERLSWIVDVGWLIRHRREIDWDMVIETGRGYERMLGLGLELARRVTGVDLPPRVRELIAGDPSIGELSDRVFVWMENPPGWIARTRFLMVASGNRRDGARLLRRILFTPSAADWGMLRLPPQLSGGYKLIRLLRLFGKAVN